MFYMIDMCYKLTHFLLSGSSVILPLSLRLHLTLHLLNQGITWLLTSSESLLLSFSTSSVQCARQPPQSSLALAATKCLSLPATSEGRSFLCVSKGGLSAGSASGSSHQGPHTAASARSASIRRTTTAPFSTRVLVWAI